MNLTNIQDIKALMAVYGIAPRKKFGQNFLIDEGVLDMIVESAGLDDGLPVLEIGPGMGALTNALAKEASQVIAVEIDDGLIPLLKGTVGDRENVTVIHGDIMKTDIEELCRKYSPSGQNRMHVAANLPYYITTPVIMMLLEHPDVIADITIMIQKEVAVRMQAGPGTKDYGALSLAVQYYSDPQIVCDVPRNCFYPAPEVDSVVIRLAGRQTPPVNVKDPDLMFKIIRATFNMRRKTLVNALTGSGFGFTRESIEEALVRMDKPLTVRGETFTLEEFAALTDLLIS